MKTFISAILFLFLDTDIKIVPQKYCDQENTQVIYSTGARGTLIEGKAFYVGDIGVCKYYPGTKKKIVGKQKTLNYIHGLAFHLWYSKLNNNEKDMFLGDGEDFANIMEYLYVNKFKTPKKDSIKKLQIEYVKNILEKKFGQK